MPTSSVLGASPAHPPGSVATLPDRTTRPTLADAAGPGGVESIPDDDADNPDDPDAGETGHDDDERGGSVDDVDQPARS